MHNDRAYTFWFLQFYISAYTTLNELLAVFLYIIFAVLLKFERSLNSYFVHNNNYYYYYYYLRLHHCKISFIYVNRRPRYCCLCKNPRWRPRVMSDRWNSKWRPPPPWIYYFCPFWSNGLFLVAAGYISAKFHLSTSIGGRDIAVCAKIQDGGRHHLEFIFCSIFWHICTEDLQRNACAKFRANMCNSKRVMKDKRNSKWRRPPSWIYHFCPFWSNGLFPVAAGYITAKFHSSTSVGSWVIDVCAKIQDGGRRHLGFIFCSIFWHTRM